MARFFSVLHLMAAFLTYMLADTSKEYGAIALFMASALVLAILSQKE